MHGKTSLVFHTGVGLLEVMLASYMAEILAKYATLL